VFYAYILKSIKDFTYYYGSTKNLQERLKVHNSGKVRYTKGHMPYKIHYHETFETNAEALSRERFFKSIDGYKWLKTKGII
jgi:predicted GIY-YIG superfamily endonuclease